MGSRLQERYGITTHAAQDLPPAVEARLDRLSRRIYRALGLSGYARMDFRVTDAGEVYVLEANANPNLTATEDFAESAAQRGSLTMNARGLMTLGLTYRAQWRATTADAHGSPIPHVQIQDGGNRRFRAAGGAGVARRLRDRPASKSKRTRCCWRAGCWATTTTARRLRRIRNTADTCTRGDRGDRAGRV